MSTIQEIESAILSLPPSDFQSLADWFDQQRETDFDRQLAADAKSGRLDAFYERAQAKALANQICPSMNSSINAAFRETLVALPVEIQELAFENFALWQTNPRHPSLQFKKVGAYWSVRIGQDYRALAILEGEIFRWFWIGTHREYEKWL